MRPASRKMNLPRAWLKPWLAGEGFHPRRRRTQTLCGVSYASSPVVRASVLRSRSRRRHCSRRLPQQQRIPHRRRHRPQIRIPRRWWSTRVLIRASPKSRRRATAIHYRWGRFLYRKGCDPTGPPRCFSSSTEATGCRNWPSAGNTRWPLYVCKPAPAPDRTSSFSGIQRDFLR